MQQSSMYVRKEMNDAEERILYRNRIRLRYRVFNHDHDPSLEYGDGCVGNPFLAYWDWEQDTRP